MVNMSLIAIALGLAVVSAQAHAQGSVHFNVNGNDARSVYNNLTGADVWQEEHESNYYRFGKHVYCARNKADPDKYVCRLGLDSNGVAVNILH